MGPLFFGGSFNPIHHAHLICARAAAEAAGHDRVVLIPSAQPPHKPDLSDVAPVADRLAMCRLAVAASPFFEVDDLETHRSGPSYTIDTVTELQHRIGQPIHWLIGADMLRLLPKWHRSDALLAQTRFVVMARPGWSLDWSSLPAAYRFLAANVVVVPQLDISATAIRERVAQGKPIDFLVPREVARFIAERELYRTRTAFECA